MIHVLNLPHHRNLWREGLLTGHEYSSYALQENKILVVTLFKSCLQLSVILKQVELS